RRSVDLESAISESLHEDMNCAFAPDGRSMIAVAAAGRKLVWQETNTGRARHDVPLPEGIAARKLTLSPDGRLLAAIQTEDNRVLLWDARTGQPLPSLRGHGSFL